MNSRFEIPDDLLQQLLELRESMRADYFKVGDIALLCFDAANSSGQRVSQQSIMDAVGDYVGKSGRTVRYYMETAAFFGPDTRAEFEVLPFAHFVVARAYDNWREILEYAADSPTMSAATLENWADERAKQAYGEGFDLVDEAAEIEVDDIEDLVDTNHTTPNIRLATMLIKCAHQVDTILDEFADRAKRGDYSLWNSEYRKKMADARLDMLYLAREMRKVDQTSFGEVYDLAQAMTNALNTKEAK